MNTAKLYSRNMLKLVFAGVIFVLTFLTISGTAQGTPTGTTYVPENYDYPYLPSASEGYPGPSIRLKQLCPDFLPNPGHERTVLLPNGSTFNIGNSPGGNVTYDNSVTMQVWASVYACPSAPQNPTYLENAKYKVTRDSSSGAVIKGETPFAATSISDSPGGNGGDWKSSGNITVPLSLGDNKICHYTGGTFSVDNKTIAPLLGYCTTIKRMQPPPTVDLKINNSDTPASIFTGEAITASWTTTNNPTSCVASQQWSGNKTVGGGSENRNADSNTSGTKTYKLTCSNASGSASDTVSIVVNDPPYISCSITNIDPSQPERGRNFTSTVNIANSSSGSVPYSGGSATLQISPNVTSGNNQAFTVPNINGNSSKNITSGSITANSGTYTLTWTISGGNASNVPVSCNRTVDVVSKPFLQAFRGDVIAGAMLYDASSDGCMAGDGKIEAFRNNNQGAGGQLGVLATGQITDFVSASLRAVAPQPPNGLTFANTPSLGGFLSLVSSTCTGTSVFDEDNAVGNTTIPATGKQVNNGDNAIVYIDGDLKINGNITYDASSWLNPRDVPPIRYIVRGNIYIKPGVTELHGTYVALTDAAGNGGGFYTCAEGNTDSINKAYLLAQCVDAPQLRVFGSVIAKKVHLLRLSGTVNTAGIGDDYDDTTAAEIFVESPLHWLALPSAGQASGSDNYESISNLPPVL